MSNDAFSRKFVFRKMINGFEVEIAVCIPEPIYQERVVPFLGDPSSDFGRNAAKEIVMDILGLEVVSTVDS